MTHGGGGGVGGGGGGGAQQHKCYTILSASDRIIRNPD